MQVQTKCDLVLRLGTRYVFIECFPAFRVLSCPDLPMLRSDVLDLILCDLDFLFRGAYRGLNVPAA